MSFSPLFYIYHLADGMSITGGFSACLNLNIFTESDDCILIEGKEYPIKTRKQSGIPGMFIVDAPEELREMWETIPVDAPPDN